MKILFNIRVENTFSAGKYFNRQSLYIFLLYVAEIAGRDLANATLDI